MGEVRKLQKKLRQIENLEVKITLTPEEKVKISRKAELRSRLADLLLQLSGPQQNLGIVGEGKAEKMKRQVEAAHEAFPSQAPSASKISKGELQSKTQATPAPSARQKEAGSGGWGGEREEREDRQEADRQQETGPPPNVSHHCPEVSDACPALTPRDPRKEKQPEEEDAVFTTLKETWEKAKFRLRLLEGHSDIVTCVVAIENTVISGSRDTTVKVWHVPTATEQRNLGGHSGGVTCLSAPPPEYCRRLARTLSLPEKERFILSGSADCCVKIWALSTGQCVKSVYTFNSVTALCFVPEGRGYFITGSGSWGKVQAWSWHTLENCQSISAHQEAVTSIQSQGPLVFSGSAEGGVSVWENLCSERDPLRPLFHWTGQVTGCGGGQGSRLALSPRGDRVFLAYGRACIKILDWRSGSVSRLTNHSSVAGVTDCVHQTVGLLIGSSYDLASGESTLNMFTLPQCRYLVSLTCAEVPRVLCFATWLTGSGDHRWVTGGRDLVVWEQLPRSTKQRGDVTVRRDGRLDAPSLESEDSADDDDDDEESDGYGDEEGGDHRVCPNATDGEPGSWFRCVLQ
ncbi:kinesin-like protein KIF21A [Lampris incognitus]|uniref:kinesin-like protein KIF21A n=1 Tax=Lampris incognitus TaxID=2546036 RepID=UPI0024B5C7E2|nr:kinesin-like protein KIF21A [Lampris incognitus]